MDTDDAVKLVNILKHLAEDYPSQPEWQDLAARVREEMNLTDRSPREIKPPRQKPAAARDEKCFVCAIEPAVRDTSMCAGCADMYSTVSSRVVRGACSCGHPPTGRKAFIYGKGRTEQTLCGPSCVKAHFRQAFRVFLGGRA